MVPYNSQSGVPVHGDLVLVQDTLQTQVSHELCEDDTLGVARADRRPQELEDVRALEVAR